jgi:hypothetical protein
LRESSVEEFAQLGRGLELFDEIQFLDTYVNAFERLQIVRGRNPSYFGSK